MMLRHLMKHIPVVLALALLAGCATSTATSRKAIFWPPAPEEPRISFVKSYRQETDFRGQSFFDSFFGAPTDPIFSKPYGVYAAGSTVYITDTISAGVLAFDMKDRKMRFFLGDQEKLQRPIGVAAGPDGTVYVSDAKLSKVFGFDPAGHDVLTMGKAGQMNTPTGIAINGPLGRIYVADSREHKVFVYSLKGEFLFSFGQPGIDDGQFNAPTNVAVDLRNGTVYVVDTLNCRVQAFDKDGKYLRKFGELGDSPGAFTRPKGIGVDSEGHVYVADAAFDNFQVFDENGQILMYVGSAGRESGKFSLPAGLFVDENDQIYVADQANQRVQVFQYLSEKWKKEHPEEYRKMLEPAAAPQAK